jgi:hypothetical protein
VVVWGANIYFSQKKLGCVAFLLREYVSKNLETTSTSQSCTGRVNKMFHRMLPFCPCIVSATYVSFPYSIVYSSGKICFKGKSPHNTSCQNKTLGTVSDFISHMSCKNIPTLPNTFPHSHS